MKGFVCVAVLAVALGVAASAPAPSGELDLSMEQLLSQWTVWRKVHGKSYASDVEEAQRFGIFVDNLKFIHSTNAKRLTYSVGVNEFADLSFAEWQSRMQLQRPAAAPKPVAHHRHTAKPKPAHAAKAQAKAAASPPAAWDWRTHGAVNPVQNQGQCGSCWAFTAGDAVSGIWAIQTGMLFPVSVQEIVDCSGSQGNEGCNGGFPSAAFQWVMANGGICDWQEYQYTAETGTCGSTNCTNVARITNFVSIPAGDEAALMGATWQQPLSCAVEAATQSWQFYTGGVLNDPTCDTNVNHGVTLIGWGHDSASGLDYWLVRNMWGASWGEQGYIRLVRNKNMCGIAEVVAYPTLSL